MKEYTVKNINYDENGKIRSFDVNIKGANFIDSLYYSEFEEFIELIEDYEEFDLIGWLNGGVLSVEDDPVEDYVIWENERISIVLV